MTTGAAAGPAGKLGEVIEASTVQVVAQSYQLNLAPPFGSLVWMPQGPLNSEGAAYGVVTLVETAALDASRRPMARGRAAESRQAVFESHPQLAELFRTHFTVRLLGYAADGAIHHALPPLPPEIHQFVYTCTSVQVDTFTHTQGYLPLLLGAPGASADEATAAFLQAAAAARPPGEAQRFLVGAAKQIIVLLRGDPARLNNLLGRLG